jgi:hypothetical protein
LPGAEFLDLMAEDSPLGVLTDDIAKAWPDATLTAVGVLDSFAIVDIDDPTGPDHELPDEQEWWDSLAEPPNRLLGVRDLDLIADDAWPRALRLLARDPLTWRAMHEPDGYTAWWIRRNALLAGAPPREWRMPDATALDGLYDPVPDLGIDPRLLAAIGVRATIGPEDAEEILTRLGDPARSIPPGVVLRAHATLAEFEIDIDPPERVRTLDGETHPAAECVVLDGPWSLGMLPDHVVVSAGEDFGLAEPLAELLDLPLASEETESTVDDAGEPVQWSELGAVVAACELLGIEVPAGGPRVHEELTVAGAAVPWWVDQDHVVHVEDSAPALGRALAWSVDRWPDRHAIVALIDEPEARTSLT